MRKIILLIVTCCFAAGVSSQHLSIKNNLLSTGLAVPNIGMEISLGNRYTLNIAGAYNPFQVNENKKWKLWLAQPELRYWFTQKYSASFVGLNIAAGRFNIGGISGLPNFSGFGNINLSELGTMRFDGKVFGGGVSYGYQMILSPHWGIEFTLGIGYARLLYDKYRCVSCGEKIGYYNTNYFGPTKAGLSLLYLIK